MGARATLAPASVTVVPGAEATVEVRVRNTGVVVDAFTLEVVGDAASWARPEPGNVSLFPGAEETVRVVFRPPATADVVAGAVPFGVRVSSREDPTGSVTEEGSVDVQPYVAVGIDVVPRTMRGRKKMAGDVAIDNQGNAPVTVSLQPTDPDKLLAFEVDPPTLVVSPGSASYAKLRIRPTQKHAKGPSLTRPFQVVAVNPEGGQVLATAPAMAVQDPLRPQWLKRAVLWGAIALVALALLWFALLKPTVESAAKEVAKKEATPVTIGNGGGGGSSGGSSGSGSGSSGTAAGSSGGVAAASAGAGQPIDGRLFVTSPGSTDFTVPDGSVLQLTDIVLQNPAGNTGSLQIKRGDTALLVVELANFRDLDYHFVAPIVFTGGQKLVLTADCTSPACSPGAYFAGFLTK